MPTARGPSLEDITIINCTQESTKMLSKTHRKLPQNYQVLAIFVPVPLRSITLFYVTGLRLSTWAQARDKSREIAARKYWLGCKDLNPPKISLSFEVYSFKNIFKEKNIRKGTR